MKKSLSLLYIFLVSFLYFGCGGGGSDSSSDKFFALNNGPVMVLNSLNVTNEKPDPNITIIIGGLDNSVKPHTAVTVMNTTSSAQRTVQSNNRGGFVTTLEGSVDDQFRIMSNGVDTTIGSIFFLDLNRDTRVKLMSGAVNRNLASLERAPNIIKIFNDRAYVINSLSDNIYIFDITHNPPVRTGIIVLPQFSDPLNMAFLDETHAYVTNTVSQNVAIVNLDDKSCEAVISQTGGNFEPCDEVIPADEGSFVNPAGIAIANGKVYVANQNLDTDFSPLGNGYITVINTANNQVIKTIETTGEGTSGTSTGLRLINDKLYVINSGNVLFDFGTGEFKCDTSSPVTIDIINTVSDTIEDSIDFPLSEANPFVCAPDSIVPDPYNKFAYFGSQLAGVLFKIDLESNTLLRGAANPIIITNTDELDQTSDIAFNSSGYGFIALFNTDRIIAFDPEIDDVDPFPFVAEFPVGIRGDDPSSDLFEGVQALAIDDSGNPDLYYITSIIQGSESLGSVETSLFVPED